MHFGNMCRSGLGLICIVLLPAAADVFTNSESTCEVRPICNTLPACWNQLPCCPESLLSRDVMIDTSGKNPGPIPVFDKPDFIRVRREFAYPKTSDTTVQNWSNQSCIHPFVQGGPLQGDFQTLLDEYPLRVINDCKENHLGSELHKKCLHFRNLISLDYILPVASTTTNSLYANRFCAECMDVQHFVAFRNDFLCSNELLGNWSLLSLERTQENQMVLLRSGLCVYYFKKPEISPSVYFDITTEHRCTAAKYTGCELAGDADVSRVGWRDCLSTFPLQDHTYCAFCTGQDGNGTSRHDNVLTKGNEICTEDIPEFAYSFYILMSIDKALTAEADDRITEPRDLQCGNKSSDDYIYDNFMEVCRRVLCPLFHVRKSQTCQPAYTTFADQPKTAIIQFHELNKTVKYQDPYGDFENDIAHIVRWHILTKVLYKNTSESFPDSVRFHGLYYNFYQKQGLNESDFILEFAWMSSRYEKLVPDSVKRLFDAKIANIPIPLTSARFQVKLVTRFDIQEDYITINKVAYKRIFYDMLDFQKSYIRRYLQMTPLIICNRVSLPLSALTVSDNSFYTNSKHITVALPYHYILTESALEMCVDDYFHLTSHALEQHRNSNEDNDVAYIISIVCSCTSIGCLSFTIATYLLFETLRTLPGKINLCLCVSLLLAQILQQFTIDLTQYKTACIIFGVLIHFSWSATLCWMSMSSFNLYRCFSPSNIRSNLRQSVGPYAVFVIIMSTLLVISNMAFGLVNENNIGYGNKICYISSNIGLLLTFVTPVGIIVLSNLCFLSVTIWRISHVPKLKGSKSNDRINVIIYLKMSTLTGVGWIFGFLGILTNVGVFEYLFILANASQGLFLMISFVCNRRVLTLFKDLLANLKKQRLTSSS